MPKDHTPGAIDSLNYQRAVGTLQDYQMIRPKYSLGSGLKGVRLWCRVNGFD